MGGGRSNSGDHVDAADLASMTRSQRAGREWFDAAIFSDGADDAAIAELRDAWKLARGSDVAMLEERFTPPDPADVALSEIAAREDATVVRGGDQSAIHLVKARIGRC